MVRTEQMSFKEFADEIAFQIEKKVINHNDDLVLPICGYEGKGKSTFSIALKCEVYKRMGRKPTAKHICFSWEEYLMANMSQVLNMLDKEKEVSVKTVDEILNYYNINLEDERYKHIKEVDYELDSGSILVYDEAGTQAYSRESMKGENVDTSKLLILNRFLNLCHFLNVPKPMSLDVYAREQRPRGMIWCTADYTNNLDNRVRKAFYYTQPTYVQIFNIRQYWNYFSSDYGIIKKHPPDFFIDICDEDLTKYIPDDIQQVYKVKKLGFGLKQTTDMLTRMQTKRDKVLGKKTTNSDKSKRRAWTKEDNVDSWSKRNSDVGTSSMKVERAKYNRSQLDGGS